MSSVNQLRRGTTCHARQKALFAYFASAEFSCHLELGWQLPAYVFMRDLVLSGGPWSNGERQAILEYCESDVVALDKLFPQLLSDVMRGPDPSQRLGQALLRGRAMKATACMEYNGVPIDTETLARLRNGWTDIQDKLIADIDKDFGVFDGRTFKRDRFTQWLIKNRIAWPTTETGQLALDADTFRQMARGNPELAPLRELRHSLSEMRLNDLAVGSDGGKGRYFASADWVGGEVNGY